MRIKGVVGMGMMTGLLASALGLGLSSAGCKSPAKPAPSSPTPSPKVDPIDPIGANASGSSAQKDAPRAKPISVPAGALTDLAALDRARLDEIAALSFEPESRPQLCILPKRKIDVGDIDVHRSLFVHDRATLDALGPDGFSLRRTLKQISGDAIAAGATEASPEALFRDLWDTQNPAASAATPEGAHCDDDGTTLNGFPNACRTVDGEQAKREASAEIASYRAVGLVNRLDLAAEGWKNCGEHRIIYGREGATFQRSFIIFEAVLPNPRPGCQSGCRAVAEHWQALSNVDDPKERAQRLETLFYKGLPGFRPVVHVDHYAAKGVTSRYGGSGSGQIRTNQFLELPWMLKEFKLALDCTTKPCKLEPVPIPVKVNPSGPLWTEAKEGLASAFQQKVLEQVEPLALDDLNTFSYQVPVVFDAARSESQNGGIQDDYLEAYTATGGQPGGFRAELAAAAAAVTPQLTDRQLVNRAAALSCAGCHQPRVLGLLNPDSIGPGKSWPDSARGFVHVRAEVPASGVHELSPALTDVFLPFRAEKLAGFLNDRSCACRLKAPRLGVTPPPLALRGRQATKLSELRDAEKQQKDAVDRQLVRQGKAKLPSLAPELAAQPLELEEVRAAADERQRAVARRKAVQKLVAQEPPRKTVTGSFRSH